MDLKTYVIEIPLFPLQCQKTKFTVHFMSTSQLEGHLPLQLGQRKDRTPLQIQGDRPYYLHQVKGSSQCVLPNI